MSIRTRLNRLEVACQPPVPDPVLEARFKRACARLAAQLELSMSMEAAGQVYRGGDPYQRLRAAERRLTCAD